MIDEPATETMQARAAGTGEQPLVSICIPTFNSAPFLEATLRSVLGQTYVRLEVIVADHGSTDATWDLLQAFGEDPRVRLMQGPPGGGAQANWNRVTDAAKGKYVKLVCADDPLYPTCVQEQVAVLEADAELAMTAARRDIIDARGAVLYRGRGLAGLRGRIFGPEAIRRSVLAGTNIFGEPGAVLIRASALRAAGAWSGNLPYLIDEDMYVRVLALGDLYAIDKSLATFRLSNSSWSLSLARQQAVQNREFHRLVRTRFEGVISSRDERIGRVRVEMNVWARRIAYFLLRRRLRVSDDICCRSSPTR